VSIADPIMPQNAGKSEPFWWVAHVPKTGGEIGGNRRNSAEIDAGQMAV
jgi:hypothetical protein